MIATDTNVQLAIRARAHRQTVREEGGNLVVNTYQDVEPHLEYAAKLRRAEWEHRGQWGKRGEFRQTMTLPMNLLTEMATKLGIPLGRIFDKENWKRLEKEYKSSDYKKLRTTSDKRI